MDCISKPVVRTNSSKRNEASIYGEINQGTAGKNGGFVDGGVVIVIAVSRIVHNAKRVNLRGYTCANQIDYQLGFGRSGGVIYRTKCCSGRNKIPGLENLDVPIIIHVYFTGGWNSGWMVFAWFPPV